ncbi:MAG: hypothetical protein AAFV33_27040, partial [Chloroflexota bacterium]
ITVYSGNKLLFAEFVQMMPHSDRSDGFFPHSTQVIDELLYCCLTMVIENIQDLLSCFLHGVLFAHSLFACDD